MTVLFRWYNYYNFNDIMLYKNDDAMKEFIRNIEYICNKSSYILTLEKFYNSVDNKNRNNSNSLFLTKKIFLHNDNENQSDAMMNNKDISLNILSSRIYSSNCFDKLGHVSVKRKEASLSNEKIVKRKDASVSTERTDKFKKIDFSFTQSPNKILFKNIVNNSTKSKLRTRKRKIICDSKSLPKINQIESPNSIIKESNLEDNVDKKDTMIDEFNFNLKYNKSKFTASMIKDYHANLKNKGIIKNLTSKNLYYAIANSKF